MFTNCVEMQKTSLILWENVRVMHQGTGEAGAFWRKEYPIIYCHLKRQCHLHHGHYNHQYYEEDERTYLSVMSK